MRIPAEAITATAEWWCRQFRNPEPLEAHYNGVALLIAQGSPIGEAPGVEQIAEFRSRLITLQSELAERIEHVSTPDPAILSRYSELGLKVRIEYEPEPVLADALAHAGISRWWLPAKAVSWTFPQLVAVGLDTPEAVLWQNPDLSPLLCRLSVPGALNGCVLPMLHGGPHEPGADEATRQRP